MTTQPPIPAHRLYRLQRTADMIRHELAQILKKANDSRLHQITLIQVQLSPDFAYAKIFFSLLNEKDLSTTQSALKKAMGFLRYELAHSASFRSIPKLEFIYASGNMVDEHFNLS